MRAATPRKKVICYAVSLDDYDCDDYLQQIAALTEAEQVKHALQDSTQAPASAPVEHDIVRVADARMFESILLQEARQQEMQTGVPSYVLFDIIQLIESHVQLQNIQA